ncbi:protein of unknown function (DUF3328) domain containing protein [Rhypophila decipiens]
MAVSTTLRTSLIACLSSAMTITIFLFLLRPGSNNIVTNMVDRVRTSPETLSPSSPTETACTTQAIKTPYKTFPKKFLGDPWKSDPYDLNGDETSNIYQSGEMNLTKDSWWDRLITPNGGFLLVQDEAEDEPLGFGVSMFHQLHCLNMIRSQFLDGMQKDVNGVPENIQTTTSDEDEEDELEKKLRKSERVHLLHCFEYIAQAILCAADDALEASQPTDVGNGEQVNGVNGENEIHQCRDASMLYRFVANSHEKPVRTSEVGRYSVFGNLA